MSGYGKETESRVLKLAPGATFPDLGLLIAFLAPGFIGMLILAPYIPLVEASPMTSGNSWTIGAFLFIALGALSFGVVFDGIRRSCDPYLRGTVRYELAKLAARDERQLFLAEERHRFYQFYGNMAVAVLVGGVAWLYQYSSHWLVTCDAAALWGGLTRVGGWGVLEFFLLRSARQAGQEFVYYVENVGVAQIDRTNVFREYCKQRLGDVERSGHHEVAGKSGDMNHTPWWISVVRQLPWRGSELQ